MGEGARQISTSTTANEVIKSLPNVLCNHFPVDILPVGSFQAATYIARALATADHSDESFYVVDLSHVAQRYHQWVSLLPRVKPFYAVKCNPDPAVIRTLALLDAGFDCASKTEIQQVLDCGVGTDRIIFANPCKQAPQLRYAQEKNVRTVTFDNKEELYKLHSMGINMDLVLRIYTEDSHSLIPLGSKFGAQLSDCENLLKIAKGLGQRVIGVSFHVGSGCFSVDSFVDAIKSARSVFDLAVSLGLPPMTLLDLGGGFPGSDKGLDGISFQEIAVVLSPLLDTLFPPEVKVIAEPGRYFVCSAYTLAVNVFSRRVVCPTQGPEYKYTHPPKRLSGTDPDITSSITDDRITNPPLHFDHLVPPSKSPIPPLDSPSDSDSEAAAEPAFHYYISDGVYGSFKDHLLVQAEFVPHVVPTSKCATRTHMYKSSLFGPTYDSLDCVATDIMLPELQVGQWLYFEEMGAYTISLASKFNGFATPRCIYVWPE